MEKKAEKNMNFLKKNQKKYDILLYKLFGILEKQMKLRENEEKVLSELVLLLKEILETSNIDFHSQITEKTLCWKSIVISKLSNYPFSAQLLSKKEEFLRFSMLFNKESLLFTENSLGMSFLRMKFFFSFKEFEKNALIKT